MQVPYPLCDPLELVEILTPPKAAESIVPVSVFIKPRALDLQPSDGPIALPISLPDNQIACRSIASISGAGIPVLKSGPQVCALSYRSASQKCTELEYELALIEFRSIGLGFYRKSFHFVEGIESHCVKIVELKAHHVETSVMILDVRKSIDGPPNDKAQRPGRLERQNSMESHHAGPVRCSHLFGGLCYCLRGFFLSAASPRFFKFRIVREI
jgi:hypothetical protein